MKPGWFTLRAGLGVSLLLMLSGCFSANISMPWEKKVEVSDIPTREPLEIPPDLYNLPKAGYKPNSSGRNPKVDKQASTTGADEILFGQKRNPKGGAAASGNGADRTKQETLPGWLSQ
ncbi:hypothetical protein [Magnetococcus sp. PR-3]|uniref:hypothetical protein n=1 Tax=Magnetococcus sp. PR-3 TaxID=3120355 RepID=UPI002FCE448A